VRGNLIKEDKDWYVTTKKSQSSGNLVGLSSSNCLVEIPEEILNPLEGTKVECIMM
jgi:molybdopterin biosynthesis enzyme